MGDGGEDYAVNSGKFALAAARRPAADRFR
jgi:hypothetical protein